ncbi:MAG: hypothetical protein IJZ82_01775 [Lachnospiraceae bacterium]|nr:hypothetical protein [Lachnospiraceae bacterium]
MKKKVNNNFTLVILLVAAMLLIPLIFGLALIDLDSDMDSLKNEISTTLEDGEVDDVEGYGVIAESVGYGFGAFASVIIFVIILMVGGYALLLFVIALIARLIFKAEGKRLTAYRILMGVEYVLQLGIVYLLVDSLCRR